MFENCLFICLVELIIEPARGTVILRIIIIIIIFSKYFSIAQKTDGPVISDRWRRSMVRYCRKVSVLVLSFTITVQQSRLMYNFLIASKE